MKTLILGLGNPFLSDDGVGIRVAGELKCQIIQPEVTVMEGSIAGLTLLDLLADYDRAIIIDAIQTVGGKAGQIYRFTPGEFQATRHDTSPHGIDFATALELGKRLGIAMPREVIIFGIEVSDVSTFGEGFTSEVGQAIPVCVEMITKELNGATCA